MIFIYRSSQFLLDNYEYCNKPNIIRNIVDSIQFCNLLCKISKYTVMHSFQFSKSNAQSKFSAMYTICPCSLDTVWSCFGPCFFSEQPSLPFYSVVNYVHSLIKLTCQPFLCVWSTVVPSHSNGKMVDNLYNVVIIILLGARRSSHPIRPFPYFDIQYRHIIGLSETYNWLNDDLGRTNVSINYILLIWELIGEIC